MDISLTIGLVLALAMMAMSVIMGGGNFGSFWDSASLLMVMGGTAAAVLMCFPLRTILKYPKVVTKCFLNRPPDVRMLIEQLVGLAEVARREGLLALDGRLQEIENPFMRLGIQLAIDGSRPEVIKEVLEAETESMALRHKEGKALFDQAGRFAPAFGMIGTLLGLIIMLGNMSDPSSIGGGMAVALITTLYGAALSNGSFLPMAEKLSFLSKQEIFARQVIIKGIIAIQSGENPRIIEQRLSTYLPPAARARDET
jgi:chemotaxis protein MotA